MNKKCLLSSSMLVIMLIGTGVAHVDNPPCTKWSQKQTILCQFMEDGVI